MLVVPKWLFELNANYGMLTDNNLAMLFRANVYHAHFLKHDSPQMGIHPIDQIWTKVVDRHTGSQSYSCTKNRVNHQKTDQRITLPSDAHNISCNNLDSLHVIVRILQEPGENLKFHQGLVMSQLCG